MQKTFTALLVAAVTALIAQPTVAHHSFAAEFDANAPIELTGTVTKVEWANPHTFFYIDVTTPKGDVEIWALEMGPPARQLRRGWKPDSVRAGDVITVNYHPLKDGSRGGQLVSAVLADGKSVGGAGAADQN